MTCTHIISVLSLVVSSAIAAELTCGRNEVIDDCPADCPYDYCPKDEHQDKLPCPKPKDCPPAKCKCGFNYRMSENGTCIPTTECPPFECPRQNEVFQSCPSYCPSDDCSQASVLGGCPYWLLIVVNCSPQCKCIDHYWRNDGACVPYEECPTCGSCGPNEVEREKADCTSDCCPEPAGQPSTCPDPSASACKCDILYLRAANGTCIRGRDCPPIPCGSNEQFDPCPVCSEQCSNASPDGRRCRTVGRIGVTVICRPACRCIENYWRDEDSNECVPYDECPICGPNEVERDQTDRTSDCCPEPAGQPSACPDPSASACKCDFNSLRAANGTCIRSSHCPPIPCGENEIFDSCPVTSSPFCSEQCSRASPDGQRCRVVGRIGITVPCRPACRCIDNFWRSKKNKCVPYDKCC